MTAADIEGLTAAVIAEPGDDGLRLVLADALEDAGQSQRAEFIRTQVRLAVLDRDHFDHHARRWDSAGSDRESWDLVKRQRELLAAKNPRTGCQNWIGWSEPIPSLGPCVCMPLSLVGGARGETEVGFRRGLAAAVCCTQDYWLEHGRSLVRLHPLEEVSLTDRDAFADRNGLFRWMCADGGWGDGYLEAFPPARRALLDPALFALLGGESKRELSGTRLAFTDRQGADRALSEACLLWARGREGER